MDLDFDLNLSREEFEKKNIQEAKNAYFNALEIFVCAMTQEEFNSYKKKILEFLNTLEVDMLTKREMLTQFQISQSRAEKNIINI